MDSLPGSDLDSPVVSAAVLNGGALRLFLEPRLIRKMQSNQLVLLRIRHGILRDHAPHHVDLRLQRSLFGIGPVDCRVGTRASVKHAPSLLFPLISPGELILFPRAALVNAGFNRKSSPV